jgi:hypothetical protein
MASARAGTGRLVCVGSGCHAGERQVPGEIDVDGESAIVHDAARQPEPRGLGAVTLEAPGTVGKTEPRSRRHHRHIGSIAPKVRDERDRVRFAEVGEPVRERQIGVGDDDERGALVGEQLDAGHDGAGEAETRRPCHACTVLGRPRPDVLVVADDGDGQWGGCCQHACREVAGQRFAGGWVEHPGEAQLCSTE